MSDYVGSNWPVILVAAMAAFAVAAVGGMLTEIGAWYHSLRFPAWKPPNLAFGPVWTVIFTLCVAAAVMAWVGAESRAARAGLVALFAVNAGLNILWNVLFFRWRRPDWALIETGALWLSILALILYVWPISPTASLLLAPYILWVSIAWALNLAIVRLNPPFGAAGPAQPSDIRST
jgi:tryptophan-rich sensory protein